MTSLRDRQRELARETILGALADHVAETASLDFSVEEIAKRAGVSHRTVYNHFANRGALIEAFSDWADREMRTRGSTISPLDLAGLTHDVETNWRIFDEMASVAEAFARIDTVRSAVGGHVRRTRAFVELVESRYPTLDTSQIIAAAAVLRQLVSVRSWYVLTHEHGLSTGDAASATSWAIETLILALDRGDSPLVDAGDS